MNLQRVYKNKMPDIPNIPGKIYLYKMENGLPSVNSLLPLKFNNKN